MSKRWAALPWGTRWLIAAVVLALAIVWALFVPLADWLAHHDVGSVKGALHETAVDNARGRLLTLGAGLFAAGALVFTARNFTVSRRTLELTEQGQVTDRYTKAIEQLGSDKLDVRIGGIYALERVARDSARDHPTVMEVLTAFIREHSHEPWPPSDPTRGEQKRSTRPDVQAAVTVVGRRDAKRDIGQINLRDANLTGANLTGANLTRANLWGANLLSAYLTGANLTGASFAFADLTDAKLTGANLTNASFADATLPGGTLTDANLRTARPGLAYLRGADLTDAKLTGANLTNASFADATLPGGTLTDANLRTARPGLAYLRGADLTGADLTGARWWSEYAPVPGGWELDTRSGLLKRAGTGSKPAGAN